MITLIYLKILSLFINFKNHISFRKTQLGFPCHWSDRLQLRLNSKMPATADPNASTCMLDIEVFNTELQEEEIAKKLEGKYLRLISAESPAKLYCCYAVIAVLIVAVIVLSVALSLSGTKEHSANKSPESGYGTCPRGWIGYGSKCFYYSEDMRNWTFSHASCKEQEALLALFDSMEELDFLNRHKGDFDHWIGLHRESPQHLWMWTNNTEYNNLVPIRGEGPYAYLSNNGISSGRGYVNRKWICSKLQLAFTKNNGFKTCIRDVPQLA